MYNPPPFTWNKTMNWIKIQIFQTALLRVSRRFGLSVFLKIHRSSRFGFRRRAKSRNTQKQNFNQCVSSFRTNKERSCWSHRHWSILSIRVRREHTNRSLASSLVPSFLLSSTHLSWFPLFHILFSLVHLCSSLLLRLLYCANITRRRPEHEYGGRQVSIRH